MPITIHYDTRLDTNFWIISIVVVWNVLYLFFRRSPLFYNWQFLEFWIFFYARLITWKIITSSPILVDTYEISLLVLVSVTQQLCGCRHPMINISVYYYFIQFYLNIADAFFLPLEILPNVESLSYWFSSKERAITSDQVLLFDTIPKQPTQLWTGSRGCCKKNCQDGFVRGDIETIAPRKS